MAIEKFRKAYKASCFLIESVELNINLSAEKTVIKSQLNIIKNPEIEDDNDSELILNGEDLKLLNLKLDNISLPRSSYQLDDKHLIINDLPDNFTLEIETEINPERNTSLEGLYKSSGKYTTQCEAEGFRKITFYPDRPDVMAIFTTTIEANKEQYPYLLSNGNLTDSGDLEEGRHFATWYDPFPKPCYLFALVAGDYDLLEDEFITTSGREVALQIFVEKGKLNQCQHAMKSLKKAMTWDQDVYGLEYDLDIYMIVAVSDFNMGAMENKGLNIFNTCYVLANDKTATDADFEGVESVIAHEYFHNWTGNRVTCRDWFQLSLKEGLTVFRDQEFSSDMNSRAVKRIEDAQGLKTFQFVEDAGPQSHPIRPDSYIEMNNFYTSTVYQKGAEVIRMFETLFGKVGFHAGMKLYFERHDGQAVTCEDFIKAMEDANSKDLTLFRNWYRQAGTPVVSVRSNWDESSAKLLMTINQSCPSTPGQLHKEPFLIPFKLALLSENGDFFNIQIEPNNHPIEFEVSESGKEVIIQLTEYSQTLVFVGIETNPVLSLLRSFSAPVKLEYSYTQAELAILLAYDTDSFSNWEAGQSLMISAIKEMTEAVKNTTSLEIPEIVLVAFERILSDKIFDDPSLLAMSLKVPTLDYLVEQFQLVPFDELITAYDYFNQYLADHLRDNLLSTYNFAIESAAKDTTNSAGWRRLQNSCLVLLDHSSDQSLDNLAQQQFEHAKGMTNSLAALKVITHGTSKHKKSALETFYKRWQDEELVLDKWFAVQATNPSESAIDDILNLFEHADFQLSNPNKVRALVGSFARNNLQNFHRIDGAGYKLVADVIVKLNKINPQIASRLTSSFNRWKHFDDDRKSMMQQQLQRLVQLDDVSPDVYEIASKALL
jgi:aminopeptidase N